MIGHFQYERLVDQNLQLGEREEEQLISVLNEVIEASKQDMPEEPSDNDWEELALNLAGLAFQAGRSYQLEQTEDLPESNDGRVTLRLSPERASALIESLL